jgi:hypothetical protein
VWLFRHFDKKRRWKERQFIKQHTAKKFLWFSHNFRQKAASRRWLRVYSFFLTLVFLADQKTLTRAKACSLRFSLLETLADALRKKISLSPSTPHTQCVFTRNNVPKGDCALAALGASQHKTLWGEKQSSDRAVEISTTQSSRGLSATHFTAQRALCALKISKAAVLKAHRR